MVDPMDGRRSVQKHKDVFESRKMKMAENAADFAHTAVKGISSNSQYGPY